MSLQQAVQATPPLVSLWVVTRGEVARDLPYTLWKMVEDAGDWPRLLWMDSFEPTRVPRFGDLEHWMTFMQGHTTILVSDNATDDIAGFGWFCQIAGLTHASIWMAPAYRGRQHTRQAGRLALQMGHETFGWDKIYTVTPWPDARNAAKRMGFREIAFIPKLLGPDCWLLEHEAKYV